MKKEAKPVSPTPMKTLYVKFQDHKGEKKITIPEVCKVTFGPLCPGGKYNNGESATALRIYSGSKPTSTQLACFVKVESFYEIGTVSCISRSTKRATKAQNVMEGGVMKNRNVTVEVSEWKDELAEEDSEAAADTFKTLAAEHDDRPF